jgi:Putative Actinobacterial Holin-X, holin superfamily III
MAVSTPSSSYGRSIPDLLSDLLVQFTTLVRKEGQLARAEISEKVSQVAGGLALIVGGAVLLMPALVVLLEAAVAALERSGLAPHWSALIVGGVVLLIGLILLMVGVNRLKAENLLPRRTINQLQEDASVAKRQVRSDNGYQRAA